jgi:hypothetical protein
MRSVRSMMRFGAAFGLAAALFLGQVPALADVRAVTLGVKGAT